MSREPERLLTIKDAALLTSYPEDTIVEWLHSGLRYCTGASGRTRIWRKHVRIRLSDLWEWVDTLSVVRTPAQPRTEQGGAKAPKRAAASGLGAWRDQGR